MLNRNYSNQILSDLLKRRTGEHVTEVEQLTLGINSTIYKISTDKTTQYIVKKYIQRSGDTRDRLSVEFLGLTFLWNNGIHNIPEPICCSRDHQIGIYRFIPGKKIQEKDISSADIHTAVEFLESIHALVHKKDANKLLDASEACFSMQQYAKIIRARLNKLLQLPQKIAMYKEFRQFLKNDLHPFYTDVEKFVMRECEKKGIDMKAELDLKNRTLSPSDFGFHNAIRQQNNTLYFIDFEYFGWDDPAKMTVDFYLHPWVPVPKRYREYIFNKMISNFHDDKSYSKRVPLVYMLLAVKWCLIMLNVFTWPDDRSEKAEQKRTVQLEKSKDKLHEVIAEFEKRTFPLNLL